MASLSTKMDLVLDSTSDQFKTSDIAANWSKIDASPGALICTSGTRPAWTTAKAGRRILETDTGLIWAWSGTDWVRTRSKGLLAYAERTTTLTLTNTTTPAVVVSLTSVAIPDGHRPLQVEVRFPLASSAGTGVFYGSINQSSIAGTGPLLAVFVLSSNSLTGRGDSYVADLPNGLNAGTYNFSFQAYNSVATSFTSQVVSGSTGAGIPGSPAVNQYASLSVVEL